MKRTGTIAGAWLWGSVIALVIITQIIDLSLAVYDTVFARSSVNIVLAVLLAFITALLARVFVSVPRTLIRTHRTLRAAVRNDDTRAPRTLTPLSAEGALNAGEALTLTRTRTPRAFRQLVVPLLVIAIVLVGAGSFGPSLYLGQAITDLGSVFPWLSAIGAPLALALIGIPLLAGVLLLLSGLWDAVSRRSITISADDRGVSVTNALRRTQFIPWDDVKAVVRASGLLSDPAMEQYTLWGARHGVVLNLVETAELLSAARAVTSLTEYAGGRERYLADSRRLLATIAARTSVPLRTFARGYYGTRPLLAAACVGLTQPDVAATPPAAIQPDPTQPVPPFAQSMWATTQRFTLAARDPLRGFLVTVRVVLFLTILIYLTVLASSSSALVSSLPTLNLIFLPLFGVLIAGLIGGTIVALRRGYGALPAVIADNKGLRLLSITSRQRLSTGQVTGGIFVPWQRIHSWAVIPPSPRKPAMTVYAVFWDGPTITWIEREGASLDMLGVRGDAREAYRQAATALHAMVAARTGLPLHELPQPRGW